LHSVANSIASFGGIDYFSAFISELGFSEWVSVMSERASVPGFFNLSKGGMDVMLMIESEWGCQVMPQGG